MATGYRNISSPEPYLPKNTIVVMPKTPPINRGALWVLFWAVGIAMGLVLRSLIDGQTQDPVDPAIVPQVAQSYGGVPTLEVNVRAVLELPTSTPTQMARPITPTTSVTPTINNCGEAEPGKICQVPFPPMPTATAYPSCALMDNLRPGAWCIWPTEQPAQEFSGSAK
jgi:hypothetical protein